jgi:hypothetical protein
VAAAGHQRQYEIIRPTVTVYGDKITTKCGSVGVNAFYCSADQQLYYSNQLPNAIPTAAANKWTADIIMAHEYAHLLQGRTGISISTHALAQRSGDKATEYAFIRRLETQADCLSGMFIRAASTSLGVQQDDLEGIEATYVAIGDDTLSQDPNVVGNHGLARSRLFWGRRGIGTSAWVTATPSSPPPTRCGSGEPAAVANPSRRPTVGEPTRRSVGSTAATVAPRVQYAPVQQWSGPPGYRPGYGPGGRPPAPRRSPLGRLLLAVIGLGLLAVLALVLINAVGSGQPQSGAYVNDDYQVPAADLNPPPLPIPQTYDQAEQWLTDNDVYGATMPAPVRCEVPAIDVARASDAVLDAHFEDLVELPGPGLAAAPDGGGLPAPRPR